MFLLRKVTALPSAGFPFETGFPMFGANECISNTYRMKEIGGNKRKLETILKAKSRFHNTQSNCNARFRQVDYNGLKAVLTF